MNHNGFNFLFPIVERLSHELNNFERFSPSKTSSLSSSINHNEYPTITFDNKDNDNRLKQQNAKLQFCKSIKWT